MAEISLSAQTRTDFGKNASRRLRRAGRVPAVVYGGGVPALGLSLDPRHVREVLHSETGANTLFSLELDGKRDSKAMLLIQDVQYDPVSDQMLHVDLARVNMQKKIRIDVPVQLVGVAKGVKLEGGILDFITRELEVVCLPADIPDHIRLDVSELGIGDSIRVKDLPVSDKYVIETEPERPVVVIAIPTEEKEEEVAAAEPEVTEPELVSRKGKEAAEEEGEEPAAGEPGKPEQDKG